MRAGLRVCVRAHASNGPGELVIVGKLLKVRLQRAFGEGQGEPGAAAVQAGAAAHERLDVVDVAGKRLLRHERPVGWRLRAGLEEAVPLLEAMAQDQVQVVQQVDHRRRVRLHHVHPVKQERARGCEKRPRKGRVAREGKKQGACKAVRQGAARP